MTLPARLLVPAKLIFEAASKANVRAVLFGGAAVNLHGAKRETRVRCLYVATTPCLALTICYPVMCIPGY